MAADGTTGRRVNGQSLKKEHAKTMTHLVPVDRATPRAGLSPENIPTERVFSDSVEKEISSPNKPIVDEICAVQEALRAEVS